MDQKRQAHWNLNVKCLIAAYRWFTNPNDIWGDFAFHPIADVLFGHLW